MRALTLRIPLSIAVAVALLLGAPAAAQQEEGHALWLEPDRGEAAIGGATDGTVLHVRNDGVRPLVVRFGAISDAATVQFARQDVTVLPGETQQVAVTLRPHQSAAPGDHAIEFWARDAAGPNASAPYTLRVLPGQPAPGSPADAPGFSLQLDPSELTVAPGSDGSATLTASGSDRNLTLRLGVAGAPLGWSAEVDDASLELAAGGSASTMVRVRTPADAAPGAHRLLIDVTAEGASASRSVNLTVVVPQPPVSEPPPGRPHFDLASLTLEATSGGNASGRANLTNRDNVTREYVVQALAAGGWRVNATPARVILPPGATTTVRIHAQAPEQPGEAAGEVLASIGESFATDTTARIALRLVATAPPPAPASAPAPTPPPSPAPTPAPGPAGPQPPAVDPAQESVRLAAGERGMLVFRVRNPDPHADREVRVALELPRGWTATLSAQSLWLPAGGAGEVTIDLRALPDATSAEGYLRVGELPLLTVVPIRLDVAPPAPGAAGVGEGGGPAASGADASAARSVEEPADAPPRAQAEPPSLPTAAAVLRDETPRDGGAPDAPLGVVAEPEAPDLALLLAASALAAVGATAALTVWAVRRWPLLALPLYARISRSGMLAHPQRRAMLDLVAASPGVAAGELQRRMGLQNGAFAHHLRSLERAGHVVSRRDGAARRVFLTGARPPPLEGPLGERVARAVERLGPGASGAELARELGVSRQALHYHLKRLAARDRPPAGAEDVQSEAAAR